MNITEIFKTIAYGIACLAFDIFDLLMRLTVLLADMLKKR